MQIKTLIVFINESNFYSIISTLMLRPDKLILYKPTDYSLEEQYIDLKGFLERKIPSMAIETHTTDYEKPQNIGNDLDKISDESPVIAISGYSGPHELAASAWAHKHSFPVIVPDDSQKELLVFNNGCVTLLDIPYAELSVTDFISSAGASIIQDSSSTYDKKCYNEVTDFIIENQRTWKSVKWLLSTQIWFSSASDNSQEISINLKRVYDRQREGIEQYFQLLNDLMLIEDYYLFRDTISFVFRDMEARHFIMTFGCWLEALVYRCAKKIKGVDDTKSGVRFLWDKDSQMVNNELDVVAALDSRLICISCKDTDNIDTSTLNELDVYARKLGGNNAIKILVISQDCLDENMKSRAQEMDLSVVIFNGSEKALLRDLEREFNR